MLHTEIDNKVCCKLGDAKIKKAKQARCLMILNWVQMLSWLYFITSTWICYKSNRIFYDIKHIFFYLLRRKSLLRYLIRYWNFLLPSFWNLLRTKKTIFSMTFYVNYGVCMCVIFFSSIGTKTAQQKFWLFTFEYIMWQTWDRSWRQDTLFVVFFIEI